MSADKVVVETVVTEQDFLGTVETAPTKTTYPAQIKKSRLEAVLAEFSAKEGPEETVKAAGRDLKCKVLAGKYTKDGAEVTYRLCYADNVPGGIVQRSRVTRQEGKPFADTTVTLQSFQAGPGGN